MIVYLCDPRFMLQGTIGTSKAEKKDGYGATDFRIILSTRPGEATETEKLSVWGTGALLEEVQKWLLRIRDELSSGPLARELEQQRAHIQELAKKAEEIEDSYFSRAEAESWKAKLSEIEGKLAETIKASSADRDSQKKELEALHREMEALRQQVDMLSKKGFLRRFGGWVMRIAQSPEAQKLIAQAAESEIQKYLPPHHGG